MVAAVAPIAAQPGASDEVVDPTVSLLTITKLTPDAKLMTADETVGRRETRLEGVDLLTEENVISG